MHHKKFCGEFQNSKTELARLETSLFVPIRSLHCTLITGGERELVCSLVITLTEEALYLSTVSLFLCFCYTLDWSSFSFFADPFFLLKLFLVSGIISPFTTNLAISIFIYRLIGTLYSIEMKIPSFVCFSNKQSKSHTNHNILLLITMYSLVWFLGHVHV